MKKIVIVAAIVVAVAAVAFFAVSKAKPETVSSEDLGPVTVEAKNGMVTIDVDGIAVVEPVSLVTLRAPDASIVRSVVPAGKAVTAGGTVVALDDTQSRNDLGQAEFSLSQAEIDYKQAELAAARSERDLVDKKTLLDSKAISSVEYTLAEESALNARLALESADVRVRQSRLALDKARADLASLRVKAPFDGTVLQLLVEAGDLVSTNAALALFGDVSRVRLSAEVDEYDIGRVAQGQNVSISGDAIGTEPLASKVDSVSPMAEIVNNISIFKVTALVDNTDGKLRPGMSADFSIRIASDKGLVVPSKCVSTVRGRSYADVLENGEVVKKRIVTGADDGINVVVLEGLEEGAAVVVPGAVRSAAVPAATAAPTGEKSVLPITVPGSGGTK